MVLGTPVPGRVGHRREFIFLDSSTVEYAAVNRGVVGSNPTRGAKTHLLCRWVFCFALIKVLFAGGAWSTVPRYALSVVVSGMWNRPLDLPMEEKRRADAAAKPG